MGRKKQKEFRDAPASAYSRIRLDVKQMLHSIYGTRVRRDHNTRNLTRIAGVIPGYSFDEVNEHADVPAYQEWLLDKHIKDWENTFKGIEIERNHEDSANAGVYIALKRDFLLPFIYVDKLIESPIGWMILKTLMQCNVSDIINVGDEIKMQIDAQLEYEEEEKTETDAEYSAKVQDLHDTRKELENSIKIMRDLWQQHTTIVSLNMPVIKRMAERCETANDFIAKACYILYHSGFDLSTTRSGDFDHTYGDFYTAQYVPCLMVQTDEMVNDYVNDHINSILESYELVDAWWIALYENKVESNFKSAEWCAAVELSMQVIRYVNEEKDCSIDKNQIDDEFRRAPLHPKSLGGDALIDELRRMCASE